jgi:hypothetical protein
MTKYSFLGLAAILIAAGNAAKAYAEGAAEDTAAPTAGEAETTGKRRGRPPGSGKTEDNGGTGAAETDEARLARNKALIDPLIKANQGNEVKAIIAKYSKTGLKDLPAANQAQFEQDIEALTY